MSKISVITPAYNVQDYIRQAVESALMQSEVGAVIIVEDGSTDSTLEVCQRLAKENSQVRVFQHHDQQNHGRSASRNLGIQKADSEYIAFLDADDFYLPHRFKMDIQLLDNDSTIDGVYNALGFHYYSKEHQAEHAQRYGNANLTTVTAEVSPEELIYVLLGLSRHATGYFSGDALTVRRSIFEKTGLFDLSLNISEDTQLWIKMAIMGRLAPGSIDRPVAMRGVHESNTSPIQISHVRPELYLSLFRWAQFNSCDAFFKKWFYYNYAKESMERLSKAKAFNIYLHGFSNNPGLIYESCYIDLLIILIGKNCITKNIFKLKRSIQKRLHLLGEIDLRLRR